jgi:streptogramin lyase
MASNVETFNPAYGTGATVAPTASSASSTINSNTPAVVVTNLSDTIISYVRIGQGAQTATTADYPVLPGTQVSLSKARDDNTVAYITASGTGSLHIITGRGM